VFALSAADEERNLQERLRLQIESQNVAAAANRAFIERQRVLHPTFTGEQQMGLVSVLLGAGRRLLTGGAQVARRAAPALRRVAPGALALGGAVAGGAAFEAGAQAFGGDGGAPMGGAAQQAIAAGGQATQIAGGRLMITAPNGDFQLFNRQGMPIRPSLIIPAGQRLPGGATVVSTRNGGQLIGITVRRRRRGFSGEVRRVRNVLQGCKAIERAARPTKRRA